MIEAQFRDGAVYGMNIEYSFDGPQLLGTGGALKRALPALGDRFFVMYGDSYLPTNYAKVAQAGSTGCSFMLLHLTNAALVAGRKRPHIA